MKIKLSIELPTREKIVAGLTPREAHPPLARAADAVTEAEKLLERRRRELAEHERTVAGLPTRINAGEVRASELQTALRDRDAAALLVAPVEGTLAKARDRLAAEERAATIAVDREFTRRVEVLERAAAEFIPALDELNELASTLAATRGVGAMLTTVEWPESPSSGLRHRMMAAATYAAGNAGGTK